MDADPFGDQGGCEHGGEYEAERDLDGVAAPIVKATAMLPTAIASTRLVRRRITSVSSSMPTRNMNRTTPNCASTSSDGKATGRNTYEDTSGATRPRRDGPSRIPAMTSP